MSGVFAVSAVIRGAISASVTFAPSHFPVPSADVARTLNNLSVGLALVAGGFAGAVSSPPWLVPFATPPWYPAGWSTPATSSPWS